MVGDREATMVRFFNGLNRKIANVIEYLTLCEGRGHGLYSYESGETTQKEMTCSSSIQFRFFIILETKFEEREGCLTKTFCPYQSFT